MTKILIDRSTVEQALEALRHVVRQAQENLVPTIHYGPVNDVMNRLEAALAEPVLQTCNCRWDGEMQMQQCTLHEAHVDAIKEWAQRAKFAEKKLAELAEQRLTDVQQEMERSIESLKAALAEPTTEDSSAVEPVAIVGTQEDTWKGYGGQWLSPGPPIKTVHMLAELPVGTPLYTAPPQRKPMTEEEIAELARQEQFLLVCDGLEELTEIARAIERAHGITS